MIQELTTYLGKILQGETVTFVSEATDLSIGNSNSATDIDLILNRCVFGFFLTDQSESEQFTLFNYHREAPKGEQLGTKSLIQIETAIERIVCRLGRSVLIIFDSFEQEDTKAWLRKNGYEEGTNGERVVYKKAFTRKE